MQPRSKNLPQPRSKSKTGTLGESLAASYLSSHHFHILEHNYRAGYGEIDIIAKEGNTLVFVEVKTRANTLYGAPEDSVSPQKLFTVTQTAQMYMQSHPKSYASIRIDVIAIMLKLADNSVVSLKHFRNVSGG